MELAAAASGETVEVADLAELEPRLFATERQTRVLLGQLKKERRVAVDDTVAPAVVKFIAGDDRKAPASPSRSQVSRFLPWNHGQFVHPTEFARVISILDDLPRCLSLIYAKSFDSFVLFVLASLFKGEHPFDL